MSEDEDIDELLYTQEDINDWMRACDELQETLLDKREIIKDLQAQLDKQKAITIKELQSQLNHQKEMWQKLKEFLDEDKLFEYFTEACVDGYKNCLLSIKNKMQELEGEKDVKD